MSLGKEGEIDCRSRKREKFCFGKRRSNSCFCPSSSISCLGGKVLSLPASWWQCSPFLPFGQAKCGKTCVCVFFGRVFPNTVDKHPENILQLIHFVSYQIIFFLFSTALFSKNVKSIFCGRLLNSVLKFLTPFSCRKKARHRRWHMQGFQSRGEEERTKKPVTSHLHHNAFLAHACTDFLSPYVLICVTSRNCIWQMQLYKEERSVFFRILQCFTWVFFKFRRLH